MKYKKEISFLLPMLCLMVLLAGCQERGSGTDGVVNNESEISQETQQNASDIDTADTEEVSLVNETETICEKTAVNLGEEESGSRIIVQRNIQEMEMSLTVYLTDGTSATIHYPMDTEKDYAYCETAYLQYDNKESIVLEIVNCTSNYGAAEYHILHVEKDSQGIEIVEDATVLGAQPLTGDRYVYSLVGFVGNVSMISAEDLIITVYGKPAVRFVDWDSGKKDGETYYLYYDQEWKVESRDVDTNASSPLDGVTMEVTKCSDISITVKIVNDTEKYIQCGDAFYLEVQDEESGELRKLDTIIDNAAFDAIAHIIQKDSPCEMVIDFEWLYGKLEPGRYHIVKTITDFRGSGDYTDYIYTAEFTVN